MFSVLVALLRVCCCYALCSFLSLYFVNNKRVFALFEFFEKKKKKNTAQVKEFVLSEN